MSRCVSDIFANLGEKLLEFVGYNCQVFGISWSLFVFRRNGAIDDLTKRARIDLMGACEFKTESRTSSKMLSLESTSLSSKILNKESTSLATLLVKSSVL